MSWALLLPGQHDLGFGVAYARDVLYRPLGCLSGDEIIASEELVRVLNRDFAGQDISSEDAAVALDRYLSAKYEKDCVLVTVRGPLLAQ